MSFYRRRVLPHLVNLSMKNAALEPYRRRVAGAADGRVLEIGVGSGINLRYYPPDVQIVGLEPSIELLEMARGNAIARPSTAIELIEGSAEAIPLPNHAVDTVVMTWTLCSIAEPARALDEMRRVLKPGGKLLFAEHGESPEATVRRWQDRLTPLWKRIAGGCHLNRPIDRLILSAGFQLESIETAYIQGPKPLTFMYEGVARNR